MIRPERVRNDGNWIEGDINNPGERQMLLGYHQIGAPSLPDFPGWKTPHYGFELYSFPDWPRIMLMTYHPAKVIPPELKTGQLDIFDYLEVTAS